MKFAERNCPICNHQQVDVLHSQKFILPDGHPLADGYEVVCCLLCGFVYADTSVSQEAYDRFYAQFSKYEDVKTGTGGMENQWDIVRQRETAQQINNHLNNRSLSILDVGCANGGLLKSLQEIGYIHLFGIDPSPTCVENTRRLGLNAEVGSLSHPFNHASFDLVILSHTLEHVQDLRSAMNWIRAQAKDNGTIYIEVPDASRYADFVDSPFQDFNTEHINHFSMASLNTYLKTNGYKPENWGQKVIPASANKPYPAIYCFAKMTPEDFSIEKDQTLHLMVGDYIEKSHGILAEFNSRLNTTLSKSKRIIVWGTGQLTMKLLAESALAEAEITAFVDSNPINHGKTLRGIKVIAPESARTFTDPILIASTLHQQSISTQIHKMGLTNQLILLKDA